MFRRILLALDGSEHAWKALDLAADLARAHDAMILAAHVMPHEPLPASLQVYAEAEHMPFEEEEARYRQARALGDSLTAEAARRLRAKGVEHVETRVLEGSAAAAILAAAQDEKIDAIVLGSRGHGALAGLLLGSVSHKVVQASECTCIVVK